MMDFRALYIDEAFRSLRGHKRLADGAIAQLSDEQFFAAPDPESNSVAIIVKHMAGNMRSRFTDFLTSDGEKPDRNRDREFVMHNDAKREEVAQLRGSRTGNWCSRPSTRCIPTIWSARSPFVESRTPYYRPSIARWSITPITSDK